MSRHAYQRGSFAFRLQPARRQYVDAGYVNSYTTCVRFMPHRVGYKRRERFG
ncbi:hypothetical protein QNN88_00795 [Citrobacter sp. ANG330]|uniref:Uncharacterized protein n=1 Tax=Citrobacter amalonaticus TaxID=35703 RepID=A0A9C7QJM2_CITAM|nr:hypothetical protein [Citrobacter amalonaticus]